MSRKLVLIAVLVLALAGVSAGIAVSATGGGGDDQPLTGTALDKATAAALKHTGGGTVIDTEAGDDGVAYGVEIRLNNGGVAEISLDENFNVIGQAADDDGAGGQDGQGDQDGQVDN